MFCGGLAVGRGASAIGATVDEGWLTTAFVTPGELSPALKAGVEERAGVSGGSFEEDSVMSVFALGLGLTRLGFVIGIADLMTVREAMALARAR